MSGGSGLGRSIADCERMTLGALVREIDRLKDRRAEEARAVEKAGKRKR